MYIPLEERTEVEEAFKAVCQIFGGSDEALSEMTAEFNKNADEGKMMHHVLCLAAGYDVGTNIQVEVWEIDTNGYFMLSLYAKSGDCEKIFADKMEKERGIGWISVAAIIPAPGGRFSLDCDEIITVIKDAGLGDRDDLTGSWLAEQLIGNNLSYGIPLVSVYSDGEIDVSVTLDTDHRNNASRPGVLEAWKRDGSVIVGKIRTETEMENPDLCIVFYIMKEFCDNKTRRLPLWKGEEIKRAREIADNIYSCLGQSQDLDEKK